MATKAEHTAGAMRAATFWNEWHKSNPNRPGDSMLERMTKFAADYEREGVKELLETLKRAQKLIAFGTEYQRGETEAEDVLHQVEAALKKYGE